jgi:hypothetical protein
VKRTGDGSLIELRSVVGLALAAKAVQPRAGRRDGIERLDAATASIAVQGRTARRQIAAGRLDGWRHHRGR